MASYQILQLIGGGEIGGAEQHVLTLLQGINPDPFKLLSGCLIEGPFAKRTEELGIPTLRFPMKHALDLSPIPSLVKELHKRKISLIHTHGSRANLLGRLAGRWAGIPVLTTYHSSLSQDYLSRKAALIALGLDRLTLPLASEIIAVSEALASEVSSRGGKNIRTIYNGVQPLPHMEQRDYRQALRTRFRQQWKIPSDAIVLGSIARLHPTKGLEYLLEAANSLRVHFPKLHLLIIGEGPLRSGLEQKLKELHLPYTLPGFIAGAYQCIPAMDLFILPSISEGMGLVLLEAMQAQVPIIATRVGGIPEVIHDGQNGLLVPPMNSHALAAASQRILKNPEIAKQFIESGCNRWHDFSVKQMLVETEDVYLQLLRKPGFATKACPSHLLP